MDYPTLVYPKHFTALSKPCATPSYFQENPITIVMFTYDHIDSYGSLLPSVSCYSKQVRWLLTQDLEDLESPESDVITPILLLCRDAKNLRSTLKVYEYIKESQPYVVVVTTSDIAIRDAQTLYGVNHCSNSPDIEGTVKMLCTTILAPFLVPSIIGIDYCDVANLIMGKTGRILLATAKHETDPVAAITETLASLKNRLPPKPKAQYAIGYLAYNPSKHSLALAEFEKLQNGLNELFGEVESVIAVLECDEDDLYCGVMVVV
jgi:hypothetical protein